MSSRSSQAFPTAKYAYVQAPLAGQTGQTAKPDGNSFGKSSQLRNELFTRLSPKSVIRMLIEWVEYDEDDVEHAAHLAAASGYQPPRIIVTDKGSRHETKRTLAAPAPFLLVDVRADLDMFDQLHITEAVHCPRAAFLTQDKAPVEVHLAKRIAGCNVIVYDAGTQGSHDAVDVADKLAKIGVENVSILQGGLAAVRELEPLLLEGLQAAGIAADAAARAAAPPTAAEKRAMARSASVVAAGLLRPRGAAMPTANRSRLGSVDISGESTSWAADGPSSPGKDSVHSRAGSIRSNTSAASKAPGGSPTSIFKADARRESSFGTTPRFPRLGAIDE